MPSYPRLTLQTVRIGLVFLAVAMTTLFVNREAAHGSDLAQVTADGDCLRLRSAPDATGTILICLPDGTIVVLRGPAQESGGVHWSEVEASGFVGWAATAFLTPLVLGEDPSPPSDPEEDETPTGETPPSSTSGLWGTLPASGGLGLIAWTGSVGQLQSALLTVGCEAVSVWSGGSSGELFGYLFGAPDFVNRNWVSRQPAVFESPEPLEVVCSGGTGTSGTRALGAGPSGTANDLSGAPLAGGVGLVIWSGALDDLAGTAGARGCELVSVWAPAPSGGLTGYLIGAPAFVNQAWTDDLGAPFVDPATPLVVVCRRDGASSPPDAPAAPPPVREPGSNAIPDEQRIADAVRSVLE